MPLAKIRSFKNSYDKHDKELIDQSVKVLVFLTVEINTQLEMSNAVDLWELGLVDKYIDDINFRNIHTLYITKEEYAGLTLEEFAIKCGMLPLELTAAQSVVENCINLQTFKNLFVSGANG